MRKRSRSSSNNGGTVITTCGGGGSDFSDGYAINIKGADTNETPTDEAVYAVTLDLAETNATPTEELSLSFPTGIWGDSNTVPTDTTGFMVQFWLNGSSGNDVSNPSNANGSNNSSNAVVSTGALADNPETLISSVGNNVPAISFSSAQYRGWFRARTTLATSTIDIIAHSSTGAFADITMFTLASGGGDVNHLTGTFTFDLNAAGVNTLTKIQSLQIYHRTRDVIAGATPAIIDVDAGALELITAL